MPEIIRRYEAGVQTARELERARRELRAGRARARLTALRADRDAAERD
jgi:hypothetical protein